MCYLSWVKLPIVGLRARMIAAMCAILVSGTSSVVFAGVPLSDIGTEFITLGTRPVYATFAPGDDDHLFIVEQAGTIQVLDLSDNSVQSTPMLDLVGEIITGGGGDERGLLGLAFHPDYQNNKQFFVYVSDTGYAGGQNHASYIRRFTVDDTSTPVAMEASEKEIMRFGQPQSNHNGGWIDFGPNDGYLYIASGDGGGGNDSGTGHTAGSGNAQDTTDNLLGKMLRIDVNVADDEKEKYYIPASNPFVGETGDDEIWAYGLRNPWRNSFDRATGDLWIGDVGQNNREEINFQPADSPGGENYGWRLREGTIATPTGGVGGDAPPGAIDPIYDYGRTGPNSGSTVVGGFVYRGYIESLYGRYVFADTGSSQIWSFVYDGENLTDFQNNTADLQPNGGTLSNIVSFGQDSKGNLYVLELGGGVYRITGDPIGGDFDFDGDVDGDDFLVWQSNFGGQGPNGDADNDGDVDGDDFLIWQENFGTVLGQGAGSGAVPEPTSIAISFVALLSLLVAKGCVTRLRR